MWLKLEQADDDQGEIIEKLSDSQLHLSSLEQCQAVA